MPEHTQVSEDHASVASSTEGNSPASNSVTSGHTDTIAQRIAAALFGKRSDSHSTPSSSSAGTREGSLLQTVAKADISGTEAQKGFSIDKLQQQRQFSEQMASVIGEGLKVSYPGLTGGIDIGSWYRGTNNDDHPDVDIMFTRFPETTSREVKWKKDGVGYAGIDVYNPQGPLAEYKTASSETVTVPKEVQEAYASKGITDIEQIRAIDPAMVTAIDNVKQQLATIGKDPQFNWLKSWGEGLVVFNVSMVHPKYGKIDFDINLQTHDTDFGIDHAQAFNQYVDDVRAQYGDERAVQLIDDIVRMKALAKDWAKGADGQSDRALKVSSFLVEALFTNSSQPKTFDEVLQMIDAYKDKFDMSESSVHKAKIGNQVTRLVGKVGDTSADVPDDELLNHSPVLTKGGIQTLKRIAFSRGQ